MSVENKSISELKPGRYIMMDGEACKILDMQKSAPGKHGHAKYRVSAQTIISGFGSKILNLLGEQAEKDIKRLSMAAAGKKIQDYIYSETAEKKRKL